MASCSSEIVLHGCRALPIELPGHGFKTVFPPGYATPQDLDQLATARSPLADLTLDDYAEHTLGIVRRAAVHGPVVLVGHSLGGSGPPIRFPRQPRSHRRIPDQPRTGDLEVLSALRALLMADIDPAHVPAVLAYAMQPDEPLGTVLANAQADPVAWGNVPHTYIRTTEDEVIPLPVQDRMIAEADQLTPANPFTVHSLAASHFPPITHAAELATILTTPRR